MTGDVVTIVDDSAIVEWLRVFLDGRGHAPTVQQVADAMGWRSRATAHRRLEKLRERGVIAGAGRSLRLVEPEPPTLDDRIEEIESAALAARGEPDTGGLPRPIGWLAGYERGWHDGFRAGLRSR